MYTTIVVGTDGSATATAAVRHAANLARMSGATLHIASAYGIVHTTSAMAMANGAMAGTAVDGAQLEHELRTHSSDIVAKAAADEACDGVVVERHVRPGGPADVIIDIAEEERADLIVVGNKGMTGARRFLLGSVPNRVAHSAPCNILIVHTT